MKFTINRAKWRCGGIETTWNPNKNLVGKGDTALLNPEGFMCCLGQIACQLGVKKKDILEEAEPCDINKELPVLTKRLDNFGEYDNSQLSSQAMRINDDPNLSLAERERKLKSLFSKFHHTLVFKGKPVVQKT